MLCSPLKFFNLVPVRFSCRIIKRFLLRHLLLTLQLTNPIIKHINKIQRTPILTAGKQTQCTHSSRSKKWQEKYLKIFVIDVLEALGVRNKQENLINAFNRTS